MPERTEYAAGTPCWVDLTTTDTAAAGTFYATIFGWTAEPVPDPGAGGYVMFTLGGHQVAAMAPIGEGEQRPPAWMCYVATDDVDKTVDAATTAGGGTVMPPMDVMGVGRMGIVTDPTGAVVALWQAGAHKGAGLTDEPNTLTWIELATRDTAAAERFYADVFGWSAKTSDSAGLPYTEFQVGDRSVAGMMPMDPNIPAGHPAYWNPYFAVTDVDRTAGEVTALGGETLVPPSDFPGGRFAIVRDPQRAVFGLLRMSQA